VLVEGVSDETDLLLEGRWMGQAPEIDGKVYVNRGQARAGEIVRVEIEQAGDYDLVGGILGADGRAQQVGAIAPAMPKPRFPILSH
jgi:ribosomal protein S12 methylthiotransferase